MGTVTANTGRRFLERYGWLMANALVVVALLALPYLIFGHRLYIGGDDTRLYYAFPDRWLHEFVQSTWFNFSNVGSNNPQFAIAPLLLILAFLKLFGLPLYALEHFAFSAVFIGGFLAFQAFIRELIGHKERLISLIVALGYVFSPILFTIEYNNFLQSVWLITLFPLWGLLLIRYLRSAAIGAALAAGLASAVLAYGVSGIPWVVALVLPLVVAIGIGWISGIFTIDRTRVIRLASFWLIVGLFQAFWLVPFGLQLASSTSYAGGAFSSEVVDSFAPTVAVVSPGMNVVYPLLNLFHHHIQPAFQWFTWPAYTTWFDHFLWLDVSFLVVLLLGLWIHRQHRSTNQPATTRNLTLVLLATVITLFFFTVNIGWFKVLFLSLGHVPGFGMFRNYYSKFPLAYAFFYLTLIGLALALIRQRANRWLFWLVAGWLAVTVLVNAVPFFQGQMFTANIWTSKQTKRNITIPNEYLDFMQALPSVVPQGALLSLPYNIASYSYIQDDQGHVFIGRSPVQLFSGIHDFSGDLSFLPTTRGLMATALHRHDTATVEKILYLTNISSVLVTNNISDDMRRSYPFGNDDHTTSSDLADLPGLVKPEPLFQSSRGNYTLYDLPIHNRLIRTYQQAVLLPATDRELALVTHSMSEIEQTAYVPDGTALPQLAGTAAVTVTLLTPDRYRITLTHVTGPELLGFADTFDTGWRLELNGRPITTAHLPINLGQNGWLITPERFGTDPQPGITRHPDGSLDVTLTLVFYPQRYLGYGVVISLVTLCVVTLLWVTEPLRIRRRREA